jgi:integrase
MAYGCGLRVSELVNLRVCDFDTDRMMLRIGDAAKGRKHRDVPLDVGQVTLLTTLRGNAGQLEYVFEGQFGGPYSKRSAEKIYIAACRRISIEPHGGIHTLRHSFATHMIEAGYDVETVRRLLGHASLRTTQIYMHLSTKHMQGVKNPMARYRESRKQPKLRLCEVNVA